MLKKFLTVAMCCVLGLCVLPLGSCREKPKGKFYDLEEAYDSGWLTKDDIMHIVYHRFGYVREIKTNEDGEKEYVNVNFVPNSILEKLEENIEDDIRTVYYLTYVSDTAKTEYGADAIKVHFCGKYNDCYAVALDCVHWSYTTEVTEVVVADIVWGAGSEPQIQIFRYE